MLKYVYLCVKIPGFLLVFAIYYTYLHINLYSVKTNM